MSDLERDEGRNLIRWTVGAGVAAVALLGMLILVGLIAIAAQPPEWLQFGLGALLAAGSAAFAGLVAEALRPRDQSEGRSVRSTRDHSDDDRQRKRQTA